MDNQELMHHGVKGMKWGVRRYQNEDGTLTEAGRKRQDKRIVSDKATTIAKGTTLYRVSDKGSSDAGSGKLYVNTSKAAADYYVSEFGINKIINKGEAYTHKYLAKTDLKMPSKREMEKIELGLLKDKKIQRELVDSLMKKGLSREQATKQVSAYNAGKAFVQKLGLGAYGAYGGAILGVYPGLIIGNPVLMGGGAAVGAVAGATAATAKISSAERRRALNAARVSYGDVNNKITNKTLRDELAKRGYNAMKDYNDRRAFGKNGNNAIIVFDSKDNVSSPKVSKVTSKDYGKAYARNYLKEHPNSKLDFNDLVKDGETRYKKYYEEGVVRRAKQKERDEILEREKKKA